MSLHLDTVLCVGDMRVASVSRLAVTGARTLQGLAFHARKEPVAILIRSGDTLSIWRADGQELSGDALEGLCPGALERFRTS